MVWSFYGKKLVLKDEDFSKISQQLKNLEPTEIDRRINELEGNFDFERSNDQNMKKLKNLISDIKTERQKQLEQHYKKAVKQLQNTINIQRQQQAVGNYINSVNRNPNIDLTITSLKDKHYKNIDELSQRKEKKRQQRQAQQRKRKQIFDTLPDSDALQKTQRQKRKQIFDMLPDSDALDYNVQIFDMLPDSDALHKTQRQKRKQMSDMLSDSDVQMLDKDKTIQTKVDNRNSFLLGSVVGLFTLSSFILIPILAK